MSYLPRKPLQRFAKGETIYNTDQPSDHLFILISGRVKITRLATDGCRTVAGIVRAEGLFGGSCLIGHEPRMESVVAMEPVTLMAWTRAEIEQAIEDAPRFGLAISQHLVRTCLELEDRLESIALHKTPERVMFAMLQLARVLGTVTGDGAVRVPSLTHQVIADYVGTSREVVTFQMNRLRRLGMLRYSRKHIDVFMAEIQRELRQHSDTPPRELQREVRREAQSAGD